jgi:S1-C subfamily serine protease
VAGYPEDHGFTARPATIGQHFWASGPNIYDTANTNRQIYTIKAIIQPGNSGGPLLAASGRVYGVVFAASTAWHDVGYALTATEVERDAAIGGADHTAVSTQQCQRGG